MKMHSRVLHNLNAVVCEVVEREMRPPAGLKVGIFSRPVEWDEVSQKHGTYFTAFHGIDLLLYINSLDKCWRTPTDARQGD
jgi:hypothetical protein